MFLLNDKNIQSWMKIRKRGKFIFALQTSFLYASLSFLFSVIFRLILNKNFVIEASLGAAIGFFIGGLIFSFAIWYENEKRFKKLNNIKNNDEI